MAIIRISIQYLNQDALCGLRKIMEEEYKTFRDWFIKIPAKVVSSARNIYIKMAKHYHAAQRWTRLEHLILQI